MKLNINLIYHSHIINNYLIIRIIIIIIIIIILLYIDFIWINELSIYYNDNISIIFIDHLKLNSLLRFMNKDIHQVLNLERIIDIDKKKVISFYFWIDKIMKENDVDEIEIIIIIISMRILINNLLKWYKDTRINVIIWSNWDNQLNRYIYWYIYNN